MSFRIDNQNSSLPVHLVPGEMLSPVLLRGLSDIPTVISSSSMSSVPILNFFSGCFFKICQWLKRLFRIETPTPVPQSSVSESTQTLIDQLKSKGRSILTNHFHQSNFNNVLNSVTLPQFKAATIFKLDDTIISCHYHDVTRNSIEGFRNTSINRMEEALERRVSLPTHPLLSAETILLENRGNSGVQIHHWNDWAQDGNSGGGSGHTGQMNIVSATRFLSTYFDGTTQNNAFRDPVLRFFLVR